MSASLALKLTDLVSAAADLEDLSPLDILRWACDQFSPRLTFATGFGAEGCVLIDIIGRHKLPIDLFTLDTGLLFPETYVLWRRLEEKCGVTIRGVYPAQTPSEQEETYGARLWEKNPDICCRLRKVQPLRTALAGFDAWITAIRREQTAARRGALAVEHDDKFGLLKINPLVRLSHKDVWRYLLEHEVPYNALHDQGYPSIGCAPCTSPVALGEDPRAGRWRGKAKIECGLHVEERAIGNGQ